MRRTILLFSLMTISVVTEVAGQDTTPTADDQPWWFRVLVVVVSLPYTLYRVFVEGEQMHLLPAPLLGLALLTWSFTEWRRQGFWTPRIVHIMAVLALATIVLINVDWVLSGGEMWTQRYVVIAVFGLFPYVTYLVFLGPKFLGRQRAPSRRSAEEEDWKSPEPTPAHSQPGATRSFGRSLVFTTAGLAALIMVTGLALASVRDRSPPEPIYFEFGDPELLSPDARGVAKGAPDADVTVIIFGDYQCPACGAFAKNSMPRLEEAYLETGSVRFVYYDLPLTSIHDNAFAAARAAHCAEDQGAFWAYHDALYENQREWSPMAAPTAAFVRFAVELELDADEFSGCVGSDRHAALVRANDRLASALEINSTPTILVQMDGARTQRSRRYTFDVVRGTIEDVLASVSQ